MIGSPVFYYDTPDFVKDFIQFLPDISGIPVAAYVTFGGTPVPVELQSLSLE